MENPFKNIQLKNWPDYWLAVTGASFVILLGGLVAGQQLPGGTVNWVIFFGGLVLLGIGAQKAHYKVHIKDGEGNMNVWVSKWRHSIAADIFVIVGLLLVLFSIEKFIGHSEPLNPTSVPLRPTPTG